MANENRPPRVSIVHKQFETVYEHLLHILESPQKPNRSTQEQLWNIYKLLSTIQNSIIDRLGEPPTEIKQTTQINDFTITDDMISDIEKAVRQVLIDKLKGR